MFRDYWKVDYQGHKIEVVNDWGSVNIFSLTDFMGEIVLKINNEKVDGLKSFVAFGNNPSLRGDIDLGNGIKEKS